MGPWWWGQPAGRPAYLPSACIALPHRWQSADSSSVYVAGLSCSVQVGYSRVLEERSQNQLNSKAAGAVPARCAPPPVRTHCMLLVVAEAHAARGLPPQAPPPLMLLCCFSWPALQPSGQASRPNLPCRALPSARLFLLALLVPTHPPPLPLQICIDCQGPTPMHT